MIVDFKITKGDYIELIQLLKAVNIAFSGSDAKMYVDEGVVYLNGEKELRRRAKIRPGDKVEFKANDESTVIVIS